jgi:short-subunit dehydrogenase
MPKGVALITGASSGIGAELARLCAADGYGLILVARRQELLDQLSHALTTEYRVPVRTIAADLSNPGAIAALYGQTRNEPVEILINNAGFGVRGRFDLTDWDAESRLIQLNITALAHLTKLFLPDMLRRKSGRILNVGSTAAFVPGPLMAAYYASKAFVVSFSHALAREFEGTGVTVTVLCPGPTRTGFDAAAGASDTNLFRGNVMDAAAVARAGYRAMLEGRAEVIAGARNRISILLTRLAPRTMLAAFVKHLNSDVQGLQ